MKITHIVAGMIITLAFLFLLAPLFRKKEQKVNKLEVKYFELLQKYKASPNEELKREVVSYLEEYYKALGLTDNQIEEKKREALG